MHHLTDRGIKKLREHYNKCTAVHGDCRKIKLFLFYCHLSLGSEPFDQPSYVHNTTAFATPVVEH